MFRIGFDVGGTKINAMLADQHGKPVAMLHVPVFLKMGPKGLVSQLVFLARCLGAAGLSGNRTKIKMQCEKIQSFLNELIDEEKLHYQKVDLGQLRMVGLGKSSSKKLSQVSFIGVAIAGPLDPRSGILLNPTNLESPDSHTGKSKKWGVFRLKQELEKQLSNRWTIENDAAAATMGQYQLEKKKIKNLLVVTLGTGLGVGVICNGELVRAGRFLHTEAGHVILDSHDQLIQCGCGNFGCAETYLGGPHFLARVNRQFRGQQKFESVKSLVDAADRGDELAQRALANYGKDLGQFLYSMISIFAPEKIVLAGGMTAGSRFFLPVMQQHLRHAMRFHRVGVDLLPRVTVSKDANSLGALGAIHLTTG
jgi:glucokinase